MLEAYAARYRRALDESIIPFWERYGIDRGRGGIFTALDRDGTLSDSKKYIWMQGRAAWMFARLYNEYEPRPAWRDAAQHILGFLQQHGRAADGRFYFSLDRDGAPVFLQRKPYGAVFACLGMLEVARATGDLALRRDAIALFDDIRRWIADPTLLGRPAFAGAPAVSNLADVMVVASLAIEIARVDPHPRFRAVMAQALRDVRRHYDAERRILIENVPLDGRDLGDWYEGRLFNPGHSIEVAWFLLHLLEFVDDPPSRQLAYDVLAGSLEYGWDAEHGGIFYFMDTAGRPPQQLEATMKLWWPHTEAFYALVLAAVLTGEARWLEWLERVDAYSFTRFADPVHGEWFGYLARDGTPALLSKGGPYKGFFHLPRALLFSIQAIERRGVPGVDRLGQAGAADAAE